MHRRVQFFELFVHVAGDGRVADVGIDFALRGDANAHRLQPGGKVNFVGGDDHPPGSDFLTDRVGLEFSRWATNSISGVMVPARACSSWVIGSGIS